MLVHRNLVILMLLLCLHGPVDAGRIYGGHEAVPHSRPYMVFLERQFRNGQEKACDGFLLNKDFVVTAAHCQAMSYKVFLGAHNVRQVNDGVQYRSVEQAFPHEDYDAASYMNDIMLLKLSSEANFNQNVSRIPYADTDDISLPKSCIVSGWGRTDQNSKSGSSKLMEVDITLLNFQQCAQDKGYCSAGPTGPGPGDSGGPLVCDGKAYGVVSISYTALNPPIYKFTKIPDFSSWIAATMKKALKKT